MSVRETLFASVLVLGVAGCTGKDGAAGKQAEQGTAAPALQGKTVGGEYVQLSDYAGKVVLLNVWATWCKPCKQELPELGRLHRELSDRDFTVLGVTVDKVQAMPAVKHFIKQYDLQYPMIFDPDGHSVGAYEIKGYPTSFIIGRDGTLRWRRDGMIQDNDGALDKQLEAALAEAAPPSE